MNILYPFLRARATVSINIYIYPAHFFTYMPATSATAPVSRVRFMSITR